MDYYYLYKKQLYLLKQKIEQKSERDRILLLCIIIVVLIGTLYFIFINPAITSKKDMEQKIPQIQEQQKALREKKDLLQHLSEHPITVKAMIRYHQVLEETNRVEKIYANINARYISARDLAKLLHAMLKQTMGVTIEDFATVPPPADTEKKPTNTTDKAAKKVNEQATSKPATQTPSSPTSTQTPATNTPPASIQAPASTTAKDEILKETSVVIPEKTFYRLVLRGTYFPIMHYLQLLEKLPWNLYWDDFDYEVVNYPEARATIGFYTLKPLNNSQSKQGSTP